jgi:hypothetical protein
MYVCYRRIANLSQELPYVLVSCPSILSYEISKVRYPKTPWVGHRVKVFGVRFLIRLGSPSRRKPELMQHMNHLLPHTVRHLPASHPVGAQAERRVSHHCWSCL